MIQGNNPSRPFSNGLRLQSSQQVFLLPIWELMKSNLLPHRELTLKRWIRLKTALWMRTLSYCSANVQIQKKEYLIKYAKRVGKIPGLEQLDVKGIDYKLVGAYPIDDKAYEELSDGKSNRNINTMSLIGVPTCPCCGNQFGVVVCECGNIMCSDGQTTACPWCGMEGSLGAIGDGGLDITRGRG